MPAFHGTTIGRGVVLRTPAAVGTEGQAMVLAADGKTLEFADVGAESPLTLTAGDATETPLTIEGAVGQTGVLTRWENAAGVVALAVDSNGDLRLRTDSGLKSLNGTAFISFYDLTGSPPTDSIVMGGTGEVFVIRGGNEVWISTNASLGFSSGGTPRVNPADAFWRRDGAASIQQGANSSTPISQTYKGPNGSGANIAGGGLAIAGGRGTGSGNGGDVKLQVALPGASGSTLNTLADKLTVRGSDGLITLDVPTSDPSVAGALWNDAGTLKVSAG